MKLYMEVCHAALQYDMARMFVDMGIQVVVDTWDGSKEVQVTERPLIEGVTDRNTPFDSSCDVVVLFQSPDHPNKAFYYCLNYDVPVYVLCFGQSWNDERRNFLCQTARDFDKLNIVPYSITEYNLYLKHGCPEKQLHLIRFPKYLEDYPIWQGEMYQCFIACNSLAVDNAENRPYTCSLDVVMELKYKYKIPFVLTGNHSEMLPFGRGKVSWEELRDLYTNSACYFSNGTIPASLVLTLIEAMCTGTPIVAYDNGFGVAHEELDGVFVSKDIPSLAKYINGIIDSKHLGSYISKRVRRTAEKLFDVNIIKKQWEQLLGGTR